MGLVFLGTALGLVAMGLTLALGHPLWLGLLVLSTMGSGTVLIFAALVMCVPRAGQLCYRPDPRDRPAGIAATYPAPTRRGPPAPWEGGRLGRQAPASVAG